MAPTKPRLMTLEFVSVTLEIFFGGGRGLPRLDSALPQSPVLSPWSVFLVIRDDQGQVKPGGNNSTMESCKLLLLFKD